MAQGNLITNKVYIHLNVFCPLMLDRVTGHVNRTDIVTIDNGGFGMGRLQLTKKVTDPTIFDDSVSHSAVLCLGT